MTTGTITISICVADTPDNRVYVNKLLASNLPGTTEDLVAAKTKVEKEANQEAPVKGSGGEFSIEDLKKAAREVKKTHGEEFALEILSEAGVKAGSTLARSLKAIPEEHYGLIIEAWKEGPTENDEEDLDEEDLDEEDLDEEDIQEVTPDSVKDAIKSWAKEHSNNEAKAIMKKHGCASLADVGKLNKTKLTKLAEAFA